MKKREIRKANKIAKKRLIRDLHEKKSKLRNEYNNSVVYEELEKPIFCGYKMTYVLRNDIVNNEIGKLYQEILDAFLHPSYCKNKFFTKKRRGVVYTYNPIFRRKDKVKISDKAMELIDYESLTDGTIYIKNSYFLVPKITKEYYTHVKVYDNTKESELEEINNFLWYNEHEEYMSFLERKYSEKSSRLWKSMTSRAIRRDSKIRLKHNPENYVDKKVSVKYSSYFY